MSVRNRVGRTLRKAPPLYRIAITATHPSHRGRRLAALAGMVRYEVNTDLLGRPTPIRLGERSRILGYKGETNSPLSVMRNPPNWPEMLVWRRYLRPGDLFVDVGANIGAYTVYACELGAEVVAVEPVPHNADRVRENLALNGYRAAVVQKALTERPGTVRITADADSFNRLTDDGSGIEVEATTFDALLGDRTAGVKIDVEGAELLVLRGASRALAEQRISLLQLEWALAEDWGVEDRAAVQQVLADAGYELHLPERDGSLAPVGDREITSINVFALPRGARPVR